MKGNQWLSISDLMAGLMVVFMFIAISYMISANEAQQQISDVLTGYGLLDKKLNSELHREFSSDLKAWGAEITDDNTFRFKGPIQLVKYGTIEVLFDQGNDRINRQFKEAISDFFPRYVDILLQEDFDGYIEEIRIEGHTSTEWQNLPRSSLISRYLNNAKLSQQRSFSVLDYCAQLQHPTVTNNKIWLVDILRANGMSFSKIVSSRGQVVPHSVVHSGGASEDRHRTRRVDFHVWTNVERKISDIYWRNKPGVTP